MFYKLGNTLVSLTADPSYARIIHRVFTEAGAADREDAAKLLGWLAYVRRPLKWHEIQGAWSLNGNNQTFNYNSEQIPKNFATL
jgi:hypothetical protein